jgi:hypothetical protein
MMRPLDRSTQWWVRRTGRPVNLDHDAWLRGPVGDQARIAERWLTREAAQRSADLEPDRPGAGLLASMSLLDGPGFDAARLADPVRDFYEHTRRWTLSATIRWSRLAWPFGALLGVLFARRLEQLALPLRAADLADGMTSGVTPLLVDGEQVGASWLRRLRATDRVVFSGYYDTAVAPATNRRCVRVSFPLPNGRLLVLLEPHVRPDGGLTLLSPTGRWGEPGAYLVVEHASQCSARRIPIHERFDVHTDNRDALRTDHTLTLWRIPVLRLRYELTRK